MFKMETVDDLWNHIAYVMAYGPDRFPHEDFLEERDQMTLDMAFAHLRRGVEIAYPEESYVSRRDELNDILDESYQSYKDGADIPAARLLKKFEKEIFRA